ncbi:MAG: hypothetical protein LBV43_10835 [Prevotella sp.]|jgi:hypothetical protein|nr:hypothetical protein [Prevotella sp.]
MRKNALISFLLFTISISAQNYGNGLPATDNLGRKLIIAENESTIRKDKFVGLFYWTWHTNFANKKPYDVSKILAERPEAINNYNDPIWPKDEGYYFWGEPLFGYYRDTDNWVLRKHAEMLAEAGVDAIFFDCTNGSFTWKESYIELCKVFDQALKDGVNVPKIVFMLAFGPSPDSRKALGEIYNDLYKPGLYKDIWFYWKGKPLIMAYPETLGDIDGDVERTRENREIWDFFTFRPGQPVYNKGSQRADHWGWLEIFPQHGFVENENGSYEQVTVGVSQNWSKENGLSAMNSPNTFGRSYTHRSGQVETAGAVNFGYNFQEQWDRALELDPEFIFITGWNEWIAGRAREWMGQENAFPDQYSQEKSRDIEPMKGGHGDNYYYQMINNIRRFKGTPAVEPDGRERKIKIDGGFDDWADAIQYSAYKGSTIHRNSEGWKDVYYTNETGRNDITNVRVAHDKKNVYFYVETAEPFSPASDNAWMRLFIDIDRDKDTGWEGYDFVLNRISPSNKIIIEKNLNNGWEWKKTGELDYAINGNKMEICIPKKVLNIKDNIDLEFKWADNMQENDITDFYLNGDAAPLGRFNYIYKVK